MLQNTSNLWVVGAVEGFYTGLEADFCLPGSECHVHIDVMWIFFGKKNHQQPLHGNHYMGISHERRDQQHADIWQSNRNRIDGVPNPLCLWNLKKAPWQRKNIYCTNYIIIIIIIIIIKLPIFGFHVSFQGCISKLKRDCQSWLPLPWSSRLSVAN